MMTKEEAYTLLSFHSGSNEDYENEKWKNGFLGSLRPFQGQIYENNFFEVMDSLYVLADEFTGETVNQELLTDVFSIIHLGRRWIEDDSALARDKIITEEQQRKLLEWVDMIQDCLFSLLNNEQEDAFLDYEDYKMESEES